MLNDRGWKFLKHKTKPPLDSKSVSYWKRFLRSVLKIGMEFEFNLPEANGDCNGRNITCTCKHFKSGCWKKCANFEACRTQNGINLCKNRADNCNPEDCIKCEFYAPMCGPENCCDFSPFCLACEKFELNCAECPHLFSPDRDPQKIREKMISELHPSGFYGKQSESGVHSIVPDGSLTGMGGAEVITLGRRPDFWSFYDMTKRIIDSAIAKGASINERTSMHMHILASYYAKTILNGEEYGIPDQISEMEYDMPEIIAANIHQLVRKYHNVLTWLTMGLNEPDRLTRWEKFRRPVLDISAARNSMETVVYLVRDMCEGKKYGFINWTPTNFKKDGNIDRLHFEMRQSDCLLSPSAVSAMACLYHAIVIKAVEISRYGVLIVGDGAWMDKAREVQSCMLNNNKGYGEGDRFSDTSCLSKHYDYLRRESRDLLFQVKHILMETGPSYEVLGKLSEMPCALRRCEGHDWARIEKDLSVERNDKTDALEEAIYEIIDLRHITGQEDVEKWLQGVVDLLQNVNEFRDVQKKELMAKIALLLSSKSEELVWSNKLGTMMLK